MTSRSTSFANPTPLSSVHQVCDRLTWDLRGRSSPHLRLVVLQQPHKAPDQLFPHTALPHRLGQRHILVRDHVPHAPALIAHAGPQRIEQVLPDLFGRECLRERDEIGDSEQSHRVLVVARELFVQGDQVGGDKALLAGLSHRFCERLQRQCGFDERTRELTPRAFAAARRTMGVSSEHSPANMRRISSCILGAAWGYGAAKRAHADVRDVNQSPVDRRRRRGRKCWSRCWGERSNDVFEMESAA